MTVTTTVLPARWPRSARSSAKRASSTSPSTTAPLWSTAMTRSASPSKASPRSAWCATTDRASSSGSVEPHFSLILAPSGASCSALTSAPSSASTSGAMALAAPLAQSTTMCRPSRRRPSSVATRCALVQLDGTGGVGTDAAHAEAGRAAGGAVGVREQGGELALDLALDLDGQLGPQQAEQLDPVVAEGIVRGRNDGTGRPARRGHGGHARSGQHADVDDVGPLGGQAGGEGGLEERSRAAGVATDDEGRSGQDTSGGAPEGQGQLGCQLFVRNPAHTVGAEAGRRHSYRFEYCGALRAFLRPYFLDSFSRASWVRRPERLSAPRSSGSSSIRLRAMPRRMAPA